MGLLREVIQRNIQYPASTSFFSRHSSIQGNIQYPTSTSFFSRHSPGERSLPSYGSCLKILLFLGDKGYHRGCFCRLAQCIDFACPTIDCGLWKVSLGAIFRGGGLPPLPSRARMTPLSRMTPTNIHGIGCFSGESDHFCRGSHGDMSTYF